MAAGLGVIFAGGVAWLAWFTPGASGLAAAVATGLVPFLPVDILKILAAAAVMPPLWRLIGRHRC
jgi:biotin transport system substrate-specific component